MRFPKGSPEAMEHMKMLREKKAHLKMVNTAEIEVPKNLLYIDNKGVERIINTMTPKNNISRRNKEKVFKIGVSNDNDFHIKNVGMSRSSMSKSYQSGIDKEYKKTREYVAENQSYIGSTPDDKYADYTYDKLLKKKSLNPIQKNQL